MNYFYCQEGYWQNGMLLTKIVDSEIENTHQVAYSVLSTTWIRTTNIVENHKHLQMKIIDDNVHIQFG